MQPIQPMYIDDDGEFRFKANAIVRFLLNHSNHDLNDLAKIDFDDEDREQFAQLIGYSLDRFSELSYVSDETLKAALRMAIMGKSEQDAGDDAHSIITIEHAWLDDETIIEDICGLATTGVQPK